MARFDKYEPKAGGFRAPLAANQAATPGAVGAADGPIAVGLDNQGRVVLGAGNTGVLGVLCLTQQRNAGEIVDVMTHGEVVEFGGTAGTTYYANTASGAIDASPDVGGAAGSGAGHRLGTTVEVGRLVVRVAQAP